MSDPRDSRVHPPIPLMTSHSRIPGCSKYEGNMKEYVENMKEYVENMKEYVENMKKYVENM